MAEAARGLNDELRAAVGDTIESISRLQIVDEKARLRSFDQPFEEQVDALDDFTAPGVETIIHYKPRQIGDTTVLAAVNFDYHWRATDAVRTLIVTDSDETNDAVFSRIQVFYDTMPEALKRPLKRSSKKELVYADTLSGMRVVTAGGKSHGRGWTYQRLHADEMAFWPNAEAVWGSVTSTLHPGPHHKKFILSTPNGPGNLYHRMVQGALKSVRDGDTTVRFRFFRWCDHRAYRRTPPPSWEPSEDDYRLAQQFSLTAEQLYWRHYKIHGPDGIGLMRFRREYPLTIEDGFSIFEGGWFDMDYLNAVLSGCLYVPTEMRTYQRPERGEVYALGVDGSWCNGGDNAVAQVLSRNGEQVAVYSTNQGGEIAFADKVAELAFNYNNGRVLCEANAGGGGRVIIRRLRELGVRLWNRPLDPGEKPKVGERNWVNTNATNNEVYSHLRQMVNGDAMTLRDLTTVQELMHVREVDGKIEGQDGEHDDHADALGLAEWNRRTLPAEHAEVSEHRQRQVRATPNPFNMNRTQWSPS